MLRKAALFLVLLAPAGSLTGCVAVVHGRPPEARFEVRTAQPYADSVWIEGYWQRDHNHWRWQEGHWERKPSRNAEWVPGYWVEVHGGWEWKPGHWRR